MGELLEEMALTGKLKLCVGEGSAKNLQQCKRIDTTTNVNEKEKLNGPQLVGSNSRKPREINVRKRRPYQPLIFSRSPDLNIPINDIYDNAKRLPGIKRSSILQVDNR